MQVVLAGAHGYTNRFIIQHNDKPICKIFVSSVDLVFDIIDTVIECGN